MGSLKRKLGRKNKKKIDKAEKKMAKQLMMFDMLHLFYLAAAKCWPQV